MPRQPRPDREYQVVASNEKQRDQKPGGAAAAPWARSEGYGDESKGNASKGKGQATLNFHSGIARTCATFAEEGAQGAARYGGLRCGSSFEPARLDGQIAFGEGGK